VRIEPGPQPARGDRAALHLDAALGLGLGALQRGEQPLAQHAELQLVEEAVDRVPIPRAHGEVLRPGLQRHVAHQLGELPVEQHPGEVARSASPALPFTSSTRSVSSASEPNSRTHFAAVFSPTPGIEGRLSDGSPRSAAKSGYWAGVSP
jgi:hypothetical protein